MDFPESLLRGLHSGKAVTETGEVTAEAFIERESEHQQNTFEISINWEDDEFVEAFTLEQRNEKGYKLFQHGLVRIQRRELELLKSLPVTKNILNYERAPLPGNPYHGNILMSGNISRATRKLVRASLALCVTDIILPER